MPAAAGVGTDTVGMADLDLEDTDTEYMDTEGMDSEDTRATDTDIRMGAGFQDHKDVSLTSVLKLSEQKGPSSGGSWASS
jgi:hypothetical protein